MAKQKERSPKTGKKKEKAYDGACACAASHCRNHSRRGNDGDGLSRTYGCGGGIDGLLHGQLESWTEMQRTSTLMLELTEVPPGTVTGTVFASADVIV